MQAGIPNFSSISNCFVNLKTLSKNLLSQNKLYHA